MSSGGIIRDEPDSRRGAGVWWVGSLILHGGLLAALIFYAPPPRAVEAQAGAGEKLEIAAPPSRIQEVVEDIRERQAEKFDEKIAELEEAKKKVDAASEQNLKNYEEANREMTSELPQKLEAGQKEIRAGQEEALKAQQEAADALAQLQEAKAKAAAPASDEEKKSAESAADAAARAAAEAQQRAKTAQQRSAAALAEVAKQMDYASEAASEAKQAEAEALKAQADATEAQNAAEKARAAALGEGKDGKKAQSDLKKSEADMESARQRLAAAEAEAAESQKQQEASDAKLAQAQKAAADAQAQAAQSQSKEAKKKASDTAKEAERTARQAAKAKEKVARSSENVAKAKASSEAAQAKAQGTGGGPSSVNPFAQAAEAQKKAIEAQQTASASQAKASAKLAETINKVGAGNLAARPEAAPAPTAAPATPATGNDLASIYQRGLDLEKQIAESYKKARAAELATMRRIPLSEAMKLTEVATPTRPELNREALTGAIHDAAGIKAQEHEIEAASAEMKSMASLANRMANLATPNKEGETVSLDWINAQSAHQDQMEDLALEDEGVVAKDLSGMMKQAGTGAQSGTGSTGTGSGGSGTGAGKGSTSAGGSGSAGSGAGSGGTGSGSGGTGSGSGGTGSGGAGSGGAGSGTASNPGSGDLGKSLKSETPADLKPIPGRRVRSAAVSIESGKRPDWMYVNSWYLIGPWSNPGRKYLDTKFPPETVIDLDAVYSNQQNKAVRWKFFDSPSDSIEPPGMGEYEIYYAYSELWFDEAQDRWVAIGSDDQSKIWINDQLIWKSSDKQKKWTVTEGFRRVHFKQGLNRVLCRLENGHGKAGFSFILNLDDSFGGG